MTLRGLGAVLALLPVFSLAHSPPISPTENAPYETEEPPSLFLNNNSRTSYPDADEPWLFQNNSGVVFASNDSASNVSTTVSQPEPLLCKFYVDPALNESTRLTEDMEEDGPVDHEMGTVRCGADKPHCFAIYEHKHENPHESNASSADVLKMQGCWKGGDEACYSECFATYHRINSNLNNTRHCCCNTPLCNLNYTFRPDLHPKTENGLNKEYDIAGRDWTHYAVLSIICALIVTIVLAVSITIFYCVRNPSARSTVVSKLAYLSSSKLHSLSAHNTPYMSDTDSGVASLHEPLLAERGVFARRTLDFIGGQAGFGTLLHAGNSSYVFTLNEHDSLVIKSYVVASAYAAFENERDIYALLCAHPHPGFLQCFGYIETTDNDDPEDHVSDRVHLLLEYAPHGDLQEFLQQNTLSWETMEQLSLQLVDSLAFLHTEVQVVKPRKLAIAHRDLTSKNVLIRSLTPLSLCITDFNCSRVLEDSIHNEDTTLPAAGTWRYMAPEILAGAVNLKDAENALKQADTYALGLILWELLSRCEAMEGSQQFFRAYDRELDEISKGYMPDEKSLEILMKNILCDRRLRPMMPRLMNRGYAAQEQIFRKVVEECWDQDAEARISALTARARLREMIKLPYSERVGSDIPMTFTADHLRPALLNSTPPIMCFSTNGSTSGIGPGLSSSADSTSALVPLKNHHYISCSASAPRRTTGLFGGLGGIQTRNAHSQMLNSGETVMTSLSLTGGNSSNADDSLLRGSCIAEVA